MNFTLTQKNPTCKTGNTTRLVDSVYKPLSAYYKPDGTKKTLVLPFADFSNNLAGGKFDFAHLKDWTIVNLVPAGATFTLSNLKLVGNCASSTTGSPSASPTAKSNSASQAAFMLSSMFALALFVL
jgi:hypothetical protein